MNPQCDRAISAGADVTLGPDFARPTSTLWIVPSCNSAERFGNWHHSMRMRQIWSKAANGPGSRFYGLTHFDSHQSAPLVEVICSTRQQEGVAGWSLWTVASLPPRKAGLPGGSLRI